jgi:hypothetical protein
MCGGKHNEEVSHGHDAMAPSNFLKSIKLNI